MAAIGGLLPTLLHRNCPWPLFRLPGADDTRRPGNGDCTHRHVGRVFGARTVPAPPPPQRSRHQRCPHTSGPHLPCLRGAAPRPVAGRRCPGGDVGAPWRSGHCRGRARRGQHPDDLQPPSAVRGPGPARRHPGHCGRGHRGRRVGRGSPARCGAHASGKAARRAPSHRPTISFAAIQLSVGLLFAVAAIKFAIAAERRDDRFIGWLGVGCGLGVAASIDYALFPSFNPSRCSPVTSSGPAPWRRGPSERRARSCRTGRRLDAWHTSTSDGAWRATSTMGWPRSWPSSSPTPKRRRPGRPSPSGWRSFVAEPNGPWPNPGEPLPPSSPTNRCRSKPTSDAAAQDIAGRTGAKVEVDVGQTAIRPDQQETLVRIVREAVTNATRHGSASHIRIRFADGSRRVLQVADNGTGFDLSGVVPGSAGFGLVSMRERAEALGATFAVRSSPGEGTSGGGMALDAPLRVVVADDHAPTRAVVRDALDAEDLR